MTTSARKRYEKLKSSISKARSYAQLGEYWDKHDLSDIRWDCAGSDQGNFLI